MEILYKKLCFLADCKMTQAEARKVADVGSSTLVMMGKISPVASVVLEKISSVLNDRREVEDLPLGSDSIRIQTRLLGARLRHGSFRR